MVWRYRKISKSRVFGRNRLHNIKFAHTQVAIRTHSTGWNFKRDSQLRRNKEIKNCFTNTVDTKIQRILQKSNENVKLENQKTVFVISVPSSVNGGPYNALTHLSELV